ncbi:SH3 domain-containing protein [Streptomyces fulvoviolaceus]|uniref:SH3 domain-containing protein n=1 Tax=Streptomyces fulvoviolaceus TaxID=285535 RepID=UPI0021C22E0F|nr:SH3 domain-containing protein [Streptomyces fulvoviolaceus]MCT9077185.1 SH3 domain-containing protein [Streptomyces fulvoviolaceus]
MGRKTLRTLVVSGALVAGVGLVGVSAASAMVPDPGYSAGGGRTGIDSTDRSVFKSATVDGLRVRTGPGADRTILGLVYEGQPVQVIATRYDHTGQRWDEVMLQTDSAGGLPAGYVGWVSEMYLS